MDGTRIKPGGKVFRDPIHQLIRIDRQDGFVLDLIDTPEFQRLRRIRQLGVSWLTYPGAEHSRFAHSLGVFNFVQRMLEVLTRRYAGNEVEEYLVQHSKLVKAAALLHDIGHGPFSHMIERAFESKVDHEARTASMICDSDGGIKNVLEAHDIDASSVAEIIQHTSPHSLLIDLVTSQLDADRMDYLLRDSYATGVQYGHYDAEWLLNAMCVGRNPRDVDGDEPHRPWRLALDERRGEKAAEQFILARAHMNEQVYFHRVTRGFEALLLSLFQLVAKAAKEDSLPAGTPAVVARFFRQSGELSSSDWLRFDESALTAAFHSWADGSDGDDPDIARFSDAFLNRRRIFGSIAIGKLRQLETPKLFEALREESLEESRHWCTDDAGSAVYKGVLYSSVSGSEDGEEAMVESILLASGKPDRKARPIETSSELMGYLDHQRQSVVRLYYDRSKEPIIEKVIKPFGLKLESRGELE